MWDIIHYFSLTCITNVLKWPSQVSVLNLSILCVKFCVSLRFLFLFKFLFVWTFSTEQLYKPEFWSIVTVMTSSMHYLSICSHLHACSPHSNNATYIQPLIWTRSFLTSHEYSVNVYRDILSTTSFYLGVHILSTTGWWQWYMNKWLRQTSSYMSLFGLLYC